MASTRNLTRSVRLISRRYSVSGRQEGLWTSDGIVRSPFRNIDIPSSTIPEHVWQNLDRWADKTAVICGITHRQYTYHQLYKYSRNLAANLRRKLKVFDGDVVCVMMANSPEFPLAVLGILQAGAYLTTVNPVYTAHEVQRQLTMSDAKVVITSPETVTVMTEALKLAKKDLPIIVVSNDKVPVKTISFQELLRDVDQSVLKEVRRKSKDVALLPYSSGTTGMPKGVELTHRNIVINCIQQDVDEIKHHKDNSGSDQDSVIAVLPLYHIYALTIAMFHKLSVGAKIVTVPKFQPATFLKALFEHKVNLLYAAPPIILFLGSHPEAKKEQLSFIEKIMSGAAPVPKQDILRVLEKLKPSSDFLQLYGLTEASPLVSAMLPGSTEYTKAGFAVSNTELKIVDAPSSKTLGPNETGELWIRGPQVMKGYRNNPEATKSTITEDKWLKSGDIATIDKEGVVTIADRLKELIKVKGYQVPPAELESVLKEHPDVLDAGVIGVPDERAGEVPKAFIVVKNGHKVPPQDILDFVKERVAEFKRVKEIVFLDDLPKSPSGKLLRRVLKERYT